VRNDKNKRFFAAALAAALAIALAFTLTACEEKKKPKDGDVAPAAAIESGSFTDSRDGKTYKTVKIGEQVWMAENLSYKAEGSICYDNDSANCKKYGRLYDWEDAMKACPSGWHLPTKEEWDALTNFAGGDEAADKKLKAKKGWDNDGNGTDDYGFSALPGGRGAPYDDFALAGNGGRWWSSTSNNYRRINSNYQNIPWRFTDGGFLFSVRCVNGEPGEDAKARIVEIETWRKERAAAETAEKARLKAEAEAKAKAEKEAKAREKAEAEAKAKAEKEAKAKAEAAKKANSGKFTDTRDKKVYKTIKIGNQTWFAENLNYADNASKCYLNKEDNCKKYGRLYDWETAMKVCPSGWHLPTKAELDILNNVGGGDSIAGNALKANSGWDKYKDENGSGTDWFGFTALPGGQEGYGQFEYVGTRSCLWSASENNNDKYASYFAIFTSKDTKWFDLVVKTYMLSVRCLQGEAIQQPAAKPAQQPASKPAEQPKQQQSANENCSITFPKKACVSMPKGTCKLSGGKVVDKCP
jgi:uncharacterized protein (TIGR02145 family)